jgi:hypothetical protein
MGMMVEAHDIVRFAPTSVGDVTAGRFSMELDGSDVGLSTFYENIDAIAVSGDGRIVVSTTGPFSVREVKGANADLIAFTATRLGAETSGTWEMLFDGSDVSLAAGSEDISSAEIDPLNGAVLLATRGDLSVPDFVGTNRDIMECIPSRWGLETQCHLMPRIQMAELGIIHGIDALHFETPGPPTSTADADGVQQDVGEAAIRESAVVVTAADPPRMGASNDRSLLAIASNAAYQWRSKWNRDPRLEEAIAASLYPPDFRLIAPHQLTKEDAVVPAALVDGIGGLLHSVKERVAAVWSRV